MNSTPHHEVTHLDEGDKKCGAFCPQVKELLQAFTTLGCMAIYVYDHRSRQMLVSQVRSTLIKTLLGEGNPLVRLAQSSTFPLEEVISEGIRTIKQAPQEIWHKHILSMNILIDPSRQVYLNLQLTPISNLESQEHDLYICHIKFSTRKSSHIYLLNQATSRYRFYSTKLKRFKLQSVSIQLSSTERDMLRLAYEGASIQEIATILHKSVDTIKTYRRKLFENLRVNTIQEALLYCREHFLL